MNEKKIKLKPAIIWKLVTCQRITLKRYSSSMGRHLSPQYGQVKIVSAYPVLTAVNWSQHWCAICVKYQFSCAPKLAGKCEIGHWLPCGADGRASGRAGGWCAVTWLPKFLGWVDLLTHGVPELRYSWVARDVTKYQTKKLSILLSFYFHEVLQYLNTFT